jgi:hypothetical protein
MREAGDIENIANIVIGVWDQSRIDRKMKDPIKQNTDKARSNQSDKVSELKTLTFKILKNRNGQNEGLCYATVTPERFCIMNGDGVNYFLSIASN